MRALAIALKYAVPAIVVAALSVWLADRPGLVTIHWQGWRVDTTVPILGVSMALIVVLVLWAAKLARLLWSFPARWLETRRLARQRKGYLALTQGLAAVAGGDAKTARKLAHRADQLLGDAAMTDLLTAQAAVLSGDQDEAERHYRALSNDPQTALSGLRGMTSIALAQGDDGAALDWARRAWNAGKDGALGDVAEQVFGLQGKAGRWAEAETTLDEALRRRALPKDRVTMLKAVALTERASFAQRSGDEAGALPLARAAHKARPDFVPAAVLAAGLLARKHEVRAAGSVLATTWRLSPHPDVARAWGALWADQTPLAAFRNLAKALDAKSLPVAGHVALAKLAMAATLWGQARGHLETAVRIAPTKAVYGLLTDLERAERRDEAKARYWMDLAAAAPSDAKWRCQHCKAELDEYGAICSHCGTVAGVAWGQL